ncbi:peptidoglycan-binding domain-containing protein [Streptomyces inhibens]|uniref:peptidoglycan-binding domain-containing protein n=1 Tax=Streptomyces inhibens TaxID=2293571 RepID=UPI001EE7427D|nr:peptidoglycan-binding domain-containing protein [Streptomyces inhibens]UKY53273.1 peptidoglycan-binding protein [Streptomyces inhibens]
MGNDYFRNDGEAPRTARYDDGTAAHIRDYQKSVGLLATGTVDDRTLYALVGGSVNRPERPGR